MLKGTLIHPDILSALAYCGHGDKVLIADGNFPLATRAASADLVYLGLTPGMPTVTEVLAAIQTVLPIEEAEVMAPSEGAMPPVFDEFSDMLGGMELTKLGRYDFYAAAGESVVRLAISTGDTRPFANILLTVGCA